MAYCTLTNLEAIKAASLLIELAGEQTSGTPPTGTGHATTAVMDACIAKADSVIDSKLGLRYTVPFTTVPEIIKSISMDLTFCFLFARNLISMPEDIKKLYDQAIGLLDSIAKGEAGLGATAATSSLGPSIEATAPYEYNKFNMDIMERDGTDADFQTDTDE